MLKLKYNQFAGDLSEAMLSKIFHSRSTTTPD